jgi:aminoglycoside phosphotransferase (APT) family kinase protein
LSEPDASTLRWAANTVGPGAKVAGVRRLRRYGGTWALEIESAGVVTEAVLKCGTSADWRSAYACEAAALGRAHEHDLPVARVLGVHLDATGDDPVALLMTYIPGSSAVPRVPSVERLRSVGRLAGTLHRIPLTPSSELPIRARHTPWTDFALWRRLAGRYRAASDTDQDAVLREIMTELPGWSREATEELLRTTDSSSLLDEADRRVRAIPQPRGPTVFVHGDFWQGNTMWNGDRCVGLIDWEAAGAGHYGVDLGCLRWDAAILFGSWASDEISVGWTEASDCEAASVAYWDVVSALNVPADVGAILPALHEAGRTDLDAQTLRDRHESFLRDALARLTHEH